uniref:Molybdenum cofactor biosynthesis protein 1 n=1 Tax=Blastobotrys adeninivorans TaxID=409370 RepID=A0A060T230_BLAAD
MIGRLRPGGVHIGRGKIGFVAANVCRGTQKARYSYASAVNTPSGSEVQAERWQAIRHAKPFSAFLTDSFNRQHDYLRISITERCNLRCLYCMPEEGVELSPSDKLLTSDEIVKIATLFVSQGVRKIRLTGGEPSVRKDFMGLFERLGQIPGLEELCITSNGIALPRKLPKLKQYGLTGLNLSLDTLVEGKFMIMTRRKGLSQVLKCLDTALEVGVPSVKINCVVMRGQNEDEIVDFVNLTRHMPVEVRFIEYMPFDGNKWNQQKMFSYREIMDTIKEQYPGLARLPSKNGDTAKVFQVPGHAGTVGAITSMTSHFCGTCTRLRITCDGNLKVCLFGNAEVSLRDMVRAGASDDELLQVIGTAVKNKKEKHAGLGVLENMKNRPMILIGGLVQLGDFEVDNTNADNSFSYKRSNLGSKLRSKLGRAIGASFGSLVRTVGHVGPSGTFGQLGFARSYSKLTHVDDDGSAHMVDVSDKKHTHRTATAVGQIKFSTTEVTKLIEKNELKKGDALGVARIAGIMAVKATPTIIPLCHPLMITKIQNHVTIKDPSTVQVRCTVKCHGQTGVEMEAMTGATATLLTVYDMCKAVDRHMTISDVKVVTKQGGTHDFHE